MKRILYSQPDGSLAVIVPAPGVPIEECLAHVPVGTQCEIVDTTAVPADRVFRNAWFHDTTTSPQKVGTDLPKAKLIAHEIRRRDRSVAFAPHDELIAKQIPGANVAGAEAARQLIRTGDAKKQLDIDAALDEVSLKSVMYAKYY